MFKILDHLDKLENVKHHLTWGSATCPVCGGTLKFSKSGYKANSYACYTSNCHTIKNEYGVNRIKAKLQVYSPFSSGNTHFKVANIFTTPTRLLEIPIPIVDTLQLYSDIEYKPPKRNTSKDKQKRYIYFEYDAFTYVRVDTITEEGVDKYFYPTHVNNRGFSIKGMPLDSGLPVYRTEYIQRDVLVVEGEKCASFLQKLGMSAICVNSAFMSEHTLKDIMQALKDLGVENIVYLSDNDIAGEHKANMTMQAAWSVGIHADVLRIVDYYVEYSELQGFDIVDLYLKNRISTREDVMEIVNRWRDGCDLN
jgi:hypothetical protein